MTVPVAPANVTGQSSSSASEPKKMGWLLSQRDLSSKLKTLVGTQEYLAWSLLHMLHFCIGLGMAPDASIEHFVARLIIQTSQSPCYCELCESNVSC